MKNEDIIKSLIICALESIEYAKLMVEEQRYKYTYQILKAEHILRTIVE